MACLIHGLVTYSLAPRIPPGQELGDRDMETWTSKNRIMQDIRWRDEYMIICVQCQLEIMDIGAIGHRKDE